MKNFKKIYLALDMLNILLISVNVLFGVAGYLNEDYKSSCFSFFAAGFIAALTMVSFTNNYKK
jgi:hypothetical protein